MKTIFKNSVFRRASALSAAIVISLLLGIQAVYAIDEGQVTVLDGCLQDNVDFGLVCTANDVSLSEVTVDDITIIEPCDYPGDTTTFTARFTTILNAKERHDIGIYFEVVEDEINDDGALTGTCSVSTVNYKDEPDWLDLDETSDTFVDTNIVSNVQDTCGDIDADHSPLYPLITITAVCIDTDDPPDGLDLPYCTSWRVPGSNDLCTGPLAADEGAGLFSSGVTPGGPSKCKCDPGFSVPIPVPAAELLVTKTADPTSVNEPGGSVTFSVTVSNTGINPNNKVTLNSLSDDIYGDITLVQGDITATDCAVPITICPVSEGCDTASGEVVGTYSCAFTADVTGNGGDSETDTVTAAGVDDSGNDVDGSAEATVTINDVLPDITVVKLANGEESTTVLEPGGAVTFSVQVTNNSVSSDPVDITSLTDNVHGDLNGQGNCVVSLTQPQTLPYSCSFTADVTGNRGYVETDTVTASGTDDEGNPVSDSDSATVTVLDVLSSIELIKTVDPTQVEEPGGNVTYTFTVNNTSSVDWVYINSLTDNILGDLNGQGCTVPTVEPLLWLAPDDGAPGGLDSYTCTVTTAVTGDAFDEITNTATADGFDDDGEPVTASDSATVDITNAPPAASLTKTVTEMLVTYAVEVCNDSDAETLTLDALNDNIYGDITDVNNQAIAETTCVVSQDLAPAGDANGDDCYSCTFKAATTTSPTTDTVTGTVNDDDGSTPVTPSDSATVTFE